MGRPCGVGLDGSPWAGRRGSGSFRRPVCGRQGHGARPAVGPEGAAARGGHRGRGALQMAGTAACGVSQAHSWVGSRPLRPSGHTARPRAGSLVKWGRKPALMKMAEQRVEDLWGSPLSASGPQQRGGDQGHQLPLCTVFRFSCERVVCFCSTLTGVQLICSVVLVSGVQQTESVIHMCTLFVFKILFPYRPLQSMEQSSCAQQQEVLISYLFYI